MIKEIAIALSILGTVPALAQTAVTVDQLAKDSIGDASSTSLLGRTVSINPVRFGELGFMVAKQPDITFVCQSGDKSLTGRKPQLVGFKGVTTKAQGWDATTVWHLKDCQVNTAVASTEGVAKPAPGKKVYTAGNKSWNGVVVVEGQTVNISTAVQSGSHCDLKTKVAYKTPTVAVFTHEENAQCRGELTFSEKSVQVRTAGCTDWCGAAAPGFDYDYRLK